LEGEPRVFRKLPSSDYVKTLLKETVKHLKNDGNETSDTDTTKEIEIIPPKKAKKNFVLNVGKSKTRKIKKKPCCAG
jgi:hypothetical protein